MKIKLNNASGEQPKKLNLEELNGQKAELQYYSDSGNVLGTGGIKQTRKHETGTIIVHVFQIAKTLIKRLRPQLVCIKSTTGRGLPTKKGFRKDISRPNTVKNCMQIMGKKETFPFLFDSSSSSQSPSTCMDVCSSSRRPTFFCTSLFNFFTLLFVSCFGLTLLSDHLKCFIGYPWFLIFISFYSLSLFPPTLTGSF